MFPRRFMRNGLPAAIVLAASLGAYFAVPASPQPLLARGGPPILLTPEFPFIDSCEPPPEAPQPQPKPINPSQGQPLMLNPADICPGETGFRVSVIGGTAGRLVTRIQSPLGQCFDYFGWDPGEEITSGCSGEDGDNLSGYHEREVFIQFFGDSAVTLSVQCGCSTENGATPGAVQTVTVTPPPPSWP